MKVMQTPVRHMVCDLCQTESQHTSGYHFSFTVLDARCIVSDVAWHLPLAGLVALGTHTT